MNASMRYGLTSLATALVVLGLAVVIELISFRNPARKDLTANKRHSLAEQTVRVLEELQGPVTLTVFMNDGDARKPWTLDVLDLYRFHSTKFDYELIDPDLMPGRARDYNLEQYGVPVAFFETEDDKRESVTGISNVDGLEELLTNALIKITRGRSKKLYVLTGHGEASLEEGQLRTLVKAQAAMADKNYAVEPLQLFGQPRVPADCDVLLVLGPAKDVDPTELAAMRRYLESGGRAFFGVDPQRSSTLGELLRDFGVQLGNDVVIDFNVLNKLFGGDPLVPIAGKYGEHEVTRNFTTATFFPEARSVEPIPGTSLTTTALVQTSADSFTETNFAELQTGRVEMNGVDRRGPITVATLVEWEPGAVQAPPVNAPSPAPTSQPVDAAGSAEEMDGESPVQPEEPTGGRLAVFGDSDFLTDKHFDSMGNSDLFLNVVNWLAQEEDLIAIRPKTADSQFVTLTVTQSRMIFFLPVVILPALVLTAGAGVWWRRSRTG